MKQGFPSPMGATVKESGVNFALFVKNFSKSPLQLIIEDPNTHEILETVQLTHFTDDIYHVLIEGLPETFIYYYKITGHVLLDPFATSLTTPKIWENSSKYQPKAYFSKSDFFDWGNDKPPAVKMEELIIYEMHIRGFTKDPSSKVANPGTFLGVIEKIDHLKNLGINAVELMPITEFNPHEYPPPNRPYLGKLVQYWGYSPVNFFCPMNRFAKENSIVEFKKMVRALHEAGIELILDMVFNHTAEGSKEGPIFNYKKLANSFYYLLDAHGNYANYSGCGNTFNCNHPMAIQMILSSLRYWVTEMHVDGFRFDLASIFYRGEQGKTLQDSSLLDKITEDPILSKVKLIAEPWDAGGLYQVGHFYQKNNQWSEWNDKYRDSVRSFINGKSENKGEFTTRLSGSQDLFHKGSPKNSINFITCHDGFTLFDLVSYNSKHNLVNGENNRDGTNDTTSWNSGIEGPTLDPTIIELRLRQICNFHLALMVSQGIPLLSMGDEYGHTKNGNNNTWCQDNALNWFQWDLLDKRKDLVNFYQNLIHFRRKTPLFKGSEFLNEATICWHGKTPLQPNWHENDSFVAFQLLDSKENQDLFIAFNAAKTSTKIQFPPCPKGAWRWIVNTSLPLPESFFNENPPQLVKEDFYEMAPHSSLMLKCVESDKTY